MAFNPVLVRVGFAQNGEDELVPLAMANERLILKRGGVNLDMKIANKKFSGKGLLFLSNFRLVFLKAGKLSAHKGWSSAEFPLGSMYGPGGSGEPPKFQQPIFGANYLDGVSPPLEQATNPFGAAGIWNLTFKDGGCARFVKIFYTLQRAAKRSTQAAQETADNLLTGGAAAFIDPTDPSIIFVQQPVPQQQLHFHENSYIPMVPQQQPPGAHQDYSPPSPPHQGYPPPHNQGYPLPPQQGYPPPQQGYPPPHYGYPPPNQGYAPPNQGYPPPNQGYPPPQQGYPPLPNQQYPPPAPNQGYLPQTGYAPSQYDPYPPPGQYLGATPYGLAQSPAHGVTRIPEQYVEPLSPRKLAGPKVTAAVNTLEHRAKED